jgi:hypothetical protein
MGKLNIKIYRSTDTFLYLPVYIADNLDILKTILGSKQSISGNEYEVDIEFVPPINNEIKGDEGAIYEMIKNTNENTVAIAIGSPVAFLGSKKMTKEQIDDVRVVGAIIDKLTFWALATSNHRDDIENISDFKKYFKKVIYPNNEYITAHYLGSKIEKEAGITGISEFEFGDEIAGLKQNSDAVAITANIDALAIAVTDTIALAYHINYFFSKKEREVLTTGIITSKKSCERFPGIIEKIIDSIQMSIAILYTSEKTAKKNCAEIAQKNEFSSRFGHIELSEESDSIKEIIGLVYDEEFYPKHDLRITKESWGEAVAAFTNADVGESNILFEKHVDNSFVLKSTTKRLSIDFDAPRNTTPCKKHTKDGCYDIITLKKQTCKKDKNDCSDIKKLQERIYDLETIPLHNRLIWIVKFFARKKVLTYTSILAVCAILAFICYVVFGEPKLGELIAFATGIAFNCVMVVLSLVGNMAERQSKDKKNEKQSN